MQKKTIADIYIYIYAHNCIFLIYAVCQVACDSSATHIHIYTHLYSTYMYMDLYPSVIPAACWPYVSRSATSSAFATAPPASCDNQFNFLICLTIEQRVTVVASGVVSGLRPHCRPTGKQYLLRFSLDLFTALIKIHPHLCMNAHTYLHVCIYVDIYKKILRYK